MIAGANLLVAFTSPSWQLFSIGQSKSSFALQCWHGLQVVKHHPASLDLETLKRLVTITKTNSLKQFLSKDLANISRDFAGGPSGCRSVHA